MNKKIGIVVGVLILSLIIFALTSFADKTTNTDHGKLKVVTTLFPLYDFAKIIGGDKVEVFLLLPPGVEAHSFEPKPSDVAKIHESDLFVYTGKFMEPWVEDIINGVTSKNVKVVDSSDGIALAQEEHEDSHEHAHESDHHDHGSVDPHIWLGFDNAQIMVDNIAKAIAEKDPSNADYYKNNVAAYKNQLISLDDEYRATLAKCESKEIVYGGHYAFGYMARRYGLIYSAAQGFSPDSEPTVNDLVALVRQIKEHNIKYVFYEELSSPKIAETLANETSANMLLLNGAHNLGKEDYENNVSFMALMENNLKNLSIGLGCSY